MEHGAESLAWSSCGSAGTEFGDDVDAEVGVGSSGLWDVAGPTASVLHSLAGPPVWRSGVAACQRRRRDLGGGGEGGSEVLGLGGGCWMGVGRRRGSRPLKKGPEILEPRARRGHRGDCARIRARGEIGIRRGSAGFRLGVEFLEGGRSREAAQWVLRGRRSTAQRRPGRKQNRAGAAFAGGGRGRVRQAGPGCSEGKARRGWALAGARRGDGPGERGAKRACAG